jgi:nitroreductase
MAGPIASADEPAVRAVAELIRGRRTINLFDPEPVGVEPLLDAIALARWAPNHKLTEPWRYYLIGPETLARVTDSWASFEAESKGEAAGSARRKRLAGIPGHFVVTSARHVDANIDRENYAACCCAVQNLMLYLWQRGIGVKWTTGGITRQPRFYDALGIDAAAETIVGYFWYGHPAVIAPQQRRAAEDSVVRLA